MSNLRTKQYTRHSIFASKLRNTPVWSIISVDDTVIMTSNETTSLTNTQKIGKRREWWRLMTERKNQIFINDVTGALVKYEVNRGHTMSFAWKSDSSLSVSELKKKESEMNGRLWSEKIPKFVNDFNCREIIRNISESTDVSKFFN